MFTSSQPITACDFSADRIALLLDGSCLAAIDTAAMAQPVMVQQLEKPCTCVQFQRVVQGSAPSRLSNPSVSSAPTVPTVMSAPTVPSAMNVPTVPNAMSVPTVPTVMSAPNNATIPVDTNTPTEHSANTTPIREREMIPSPMREEEVLPSPVEAGRKRTVNPSNADSPSIPRNNEDFRNCMREVMQPMFDDLKVYIHNEILNIKETMVNQITTQEAIIDRQQQCIEMLEQLLQERK